MQSIDWRQEAGYQELYLEDGTEVASVIAYNGRKLPTFENNFLARIAGINKHFTSKRNDILIYGYMKSGTHWLWEIIQMLLNSQSQDVAAGVNKCQSFVETQTYSALDDLPSPRVLSTHLMPTGLPSSLFNNSKVVVPIRNPKDTAVSLYHHLKSETKGTNLRCGWDVFIDKVWFDPELAFYAPWTEFTSFVWKKCREEDNYHPVIYEQLLEDPAVIIKDLGSFLGVSCLSNDRIAQIVQATEFNNMKVKKADSEKPLQDTFCEGYSMFRKGQAGDWKNHFSTEQEELFNSRMEDVKSRDDNIRQVMLFYEN